MGKRLSGGKADEKMSHGGAATGGEGDMKVSTATFRQHFEMYEEDYHVFEDMFQPCLSRS